MSPAPAGPDEAWLVSSVARGAGTDSGAAAAAERFPEEARHAAGRIGHGAEGRTGRCSLGRGPRGGPRREPLRVGGSSGRHREARRGAMVRPPLPRALGSTVRASILTRGDGAFLLYAGCASLPLDEPRRPSPPLASTASTPAVRPAPRDFVALAKPPAITTMVVISRPPGGLFLAPKPAVDLRHESSAHALFGRGAHRLRGANAPSTWSSSANIDSPHDPHAETAPLPAGRLAPKAGARVRGGRCRSLSVPILAFGCERGSPRSWRCSPTSSTSWRTPPLKQPLRNPGARGGGDSRSDSPHPRWTAGRLNRGRRGGPSSSSPFPLLLAAPPLPRDISRSSRARRNTRGRGSWVLLPKRSRRRPSAKHANRPLPRGLHPRGLPSSSSPRWASPTASTCFVATGLGLGFFGWGVAGGSGRRAETGLGAVPLRDSRSFYLVLLFCDADDRPPFA